MLKFYLFYMKSVCVGILSDKQPVTRCDFSSRCFWLRDAKHTWWQYVNFFFCRILVFVLGFIWNYWIFMFQLFPYEMCFVGLLMEVQHRQYVIFHMKHVIQDKTMCLALVAWMGDGKWLRCSPHGWYLMNQGILCQLFVLFLRFGSHMKLSPLLISYEMFLRFFSYLKTTWWG